MEASLGLAADLLFGPVRAIDINKGEVRALKSRVDRVHSSRVVLHDRSEIFTLRPDDDRRASEPLIFLSLDVVADPESRAVRGHEARRRIERANFLW